jgi:hypothetical protein
MATLGSVKRQTQYPEFGPNFTTEYCPKFRAFSQYYPEAESLYGLSDYEKVRARAPDVFASIKKCDVPPIFPNGLILNHTLELVEAYLAPYLTSTIGFCEESQFNLSTSAGFVYLQKGIPKKSQAIGSKVFKDLYSRHDHINPAKISDKVEMLPNEDLKRNKVRTIFVDPLDKLAKMKFLFDKQNKKLTQNCKRLWIKYGMSKQYGGFHEFIKLLEKFELRDQSDISGYDRTIFLYYVYYIRWKLLRLPPEYEEMFWTMVFQTIFPTVVGPDGTCFMRQTGNNSGGNNTASDNSIAHLIVIIYFLVKTYYERNQLLLPLSDIMSNAEFGIYSDDQLGSLNWRFFGWLSSEEYTSDKIRAYQDWGLQIKPTATLVTIGSGRLHPDHEFLGSFCHFDENSNRYLPFPRVGKICSSVTRLGMNTTLTEDEFFEKVLALTFLSLPCKEVFPVLVKYLEYLYVTSTCPSVLRQVLSVNDLDFLENSFLRLHLGWESFTPNLSLSSDFFYFLSEYGGGGFKSEMSRTAQNERLIQLLESRAGLSTDATSCLIACCDPFFDGDMPHLNGLPDAKTGKSVTTVVTQELQISAPAGQTTNWSMLIHTNPWTADLNVGGLTPATGFDFYGNVLRPPAAARNQLSRLPSVAVYRGNDGNSLGPFNASDVGNVQPIGLGLPDTYTLGVGRLIGMGLEYYDSTNALSRQGTVRCFRQPTNSFEAKSHAEYISNTLVNPPLYGGTTAILMRRPPATPAEANLLQGTCGWKAEDGFYMVCTPIEANLPAKTVDDTQPIIFSGDFMTGPRNFAAPASVISGSTATVPAAGGQALTPGGIFNLVPFNMSGAIFTGLHPAHTGLLRVRYIYERFPSPDEADISLIAQPCAVYEPDYEYIFTMMIRQMPVAMQVSANGLGEWLSSAFSWVFPNLRKGIHAISAPDDAKESTNEQKEITRLSKAVEKMAARPIMPQSPPVRTNNKANNPPKKKPVPNSRSRGNKKPAPKRKAPIKK